MATLRRGKGLQRVVGVLAATMRPPAPFAGGDVRRRPEHEPNRRQPLLRRAIREIRERKEEDDLNLISIVCHLRPLILPSWAANSNGFPN